MNQPDLIRIRHMIDAAEEIASFIKGKTIENLIQSRQLTLSLLKLVEIIGEAASRVSKDAQLQNDQIPWTEIIGMRNRLIHVYFDIDIERVWDTVQLDIPELALKLKNLLKSGSKPH